MELKQERVTTTFVLSIEELAAVQGNSKGNLGELIHRTLTTSNGHPAVIDPENARLTIQEAPAPANRLPQDAGGKPLVRCPHCQTDMVYYMLDRHTDSKSCKARAKRNAAARRRQQKIEAAAQALLKNQ